MQVYGIPLDFNTSPSTRGFSNRPADIVGLVISIPAPPRGASGAEIFKYIDRKFQYQPLHEGLPCNGALEDIRVISIPAPPRGASSIVLVCADPHVFQYQPLHEGLRWTARQVMPMALFQYQPLHEGLPQPSSGSSVPGDFNTSPSTRGFKTDEYRGLVYTISIPAPPRGASLPDHN